MTCLPQLVSVAEVCDIGNGYAFKSTEFKTKGVPLLRISNINNERVLFGDRTVYVDESNLTKNSNFIVNKGDVVIALSGATTGKYGIYELETPALLNQRIGIIRRGESSIIDSRYFYFYLSELKAEILRKAKGAAQPNISTKEIGQFKIPLPPLPEQKKIAEILDAADSLRQKDQQLIEHYNALSQSLFLEMFGDPVTNTKEWTICNLDEVIDSIGSGWSPVCKKEKRLSEVEWAVLKLSAVTYFVYNSAENKLLPDQGIARSSIEVKTGDLLFTRKNTFELVGACAYVFSTEKRLMLPDTIFRLNYDLSKCNPIFLWFLFKHEGFRQRLKLLATGTAGSMPNISKVKLNKLKMPLPYLELQNQFAKLIETIQKQKLQVESSSIESERLFNSLLQKAFKGELTS